MSVLHMFELLRGLPLGIGYIRGVVMNPLPEGEVERERESK